MTVRRVLVGMSAAMLCAVVPPATVVATCDGEMEWPRSPEAISGSGYVARAVSSHEGEGAVEVAYRLEVESRLRGPQVSELLLRPHCVDTPISIGATYLILAGDAVTILGDGLAALDYDDHSAVVWRTYDDDKLSLVGYGEGVHDAPKFVTRLHDLDDSIALLAAHDLPDTSTSGVRNRIDVSRGSGLADVISRWIDQILNRVMEVFGPMRG